MSTTCPLQIAGAKCKVCGRNIVLSSEGKLCAHCGTFVHLACEPQDSCDVCGQPFQQYEPPEADPLREAILPRALQPSKNGGPVLMLAALLAFLLFIACFLFLRLLPYGH